MCIRDRYSLFPENPHDRAVIADFVNQLGNASIRTMGPELIFGRLFDEIGFHVIPEQLFRDIVVARLVYPTSKLKTTDYLYRYQGKVMNVQDVYRFLDRLNERYAEQAKQIAYAHTKKILEHITVVFYDMTSLYFEAEDEDDLRKIGFSKDGKFQNPQIMLGLLVGEKGYPIGYDIFEGNTFEGKTLLPVLKKIQERYSFGKPVVVADAAMLSKDNLDALDLAKYPQLGGSGLHIAHLLWGGLALVVAFDVEFVGGDQFAGLQVQCAHADALVEDLLHLGGRDRLSGLGQAGCQQHVLLLVELGVGFLLFAQAHGGGGHQQGADNAHPGGKQHRVARGIKFRHGAFPSGAGWPAPARNR